MSIVLPFAETFLVEEVSRDVLIPKSIATTGICIYFRKYTAVYLEALEPGMRIHHGLEELPE
jgi:hypothetical protein